MKISLKSMVILFKNIGWRLPIFSLVCLLIIPAPVAYAALPLSPKDIESINKDEVYRDPEEVVACSADNYSSSADGPPVGNGVYFMGDSLTVGMNSSSLAENSLSSKLEAAGWAATINGKGCRPLYNATDENGFTGTPPACPAGLITSAFNELPIDEAKIKESGTVVVALGTNNREGSEEVFIEKGVDYIRQLREINPNIGNHIYWVNTHTDGGGKAERSESIAEVVKRTGIHLIDYRAAALAEPAVYTYPSNDKTHNDGNGYINKVNLIVSSIGSPTEGASPTAGGGGGGGGYDPLSLTFPAFPDEAAIVSGIEETVRNRYSQSPWLGKAQWIVDQSRINNVNPLFVVSSGGVESTFGDSKWGRLNNNYFGIDQGKKEFPGGTEEGILYFIEIIPKYLAGDGASGKYANVKDIYEYSSVHQAGSIVYPGGDFDPGDVDSKPGITKDLYDDTMDVWVSWTISDHPNDKFDGQVFNPLVYYSSNVQIINEITGLSLSTEPGGNTSVNTCGDNTLSAGSLGWDLPGEGPNPMIYYSQMRQGDDEAVTGYYGNDPYGDGTISGCGCGPTSFAMIVSTLTGTTVTPTEVAAWASENGQQQGEEGSCGGSAWWWVGIPEASEQKWGVRARQITIGESVAELQKGNLIITSVGPGSILLSPGGSGHLLVMRGFTSEGKYLFADPSDSPGKRAAYPEIQERGSSRTPLDSATVSNGLKGLFVVERI